jgi:hypothetical protein
VLAKLGLPPPRELEEKDLSSDGTCRRAAPHRIDL